MKPYLLGSIITMIPIGLALDVIVWRRRHLASLLVYYELLSLIIQTFCPYDYGNFKHLLIMLTAVK